MTRYYRDSDGNYIGAFLNAEPPIGSIEVLFPPDSQIGYVWNGQTWVLI